MLDDLLRHAINVHLETKKTKGEGEQLSLLDSSLEPLSNVGPKQCDICRYWFFDLPIHHRVWHGKVNGVQGFWSRYTNYRPHNGHVMELVKNYAEVKVQQ